MSALSDYLENLLVDGFFRGGAINSAGAAGSTAVVNKGIRTNNTVYAAGDRVAPNAVDTGAGGKFLQCTTGGTSQTTLAALAIGNPGSTVTDGTVTWTVLSAIPVPNKLYLALLTINKGLRQNSIVYAAGDVFVLQATGGAGGDAKAHAYRCTTGGTTAAAQPSTYLGVPGEAITDGTAVFTELGPVMDAGTGFPSGLAECVGTNYARTALAAGTTQALTDFAGTQAAASTTASTGTNGTTSNNNTITPPTPGTSGTAWGQIGLFAIYDAATGGNLIAWGVLQTSGGVPQPKTVNLGDPAPTFAAAGLSIQIDN